MDIYEGYLTGIERENALNDFIFDATRQKLWAMYEMCELQKQIYYKDAETKVFKESGTYDDLYYLFNEADQSVNQNQQNVISELIHTIANQIDRLIKWIAGLFTRTRQIPPDTPVEEDGFWADNISIEEVGKLMDGLGNATDNLAKLDDDALLAEFRKIDQGTNGQVTGSGNRDWLKIAGVIAGGIGLTGMAVNAIMKAGNSDNVDETLNQNSGNKVQSTAGQVTQWINIFQKGVSVSSKVTNNLQVIKQKLTKMTDNSSQQFSNFIDGFCRWWGGVVRGIGNWMGKIGGPLEGVAKKLQESGQNTIDKHTANSNDSNDPNANNQDQNQQNGNQGDGNATTNATPDANNTADNSNTQPNDANNQNAGQAGTTQASNNVPPTNNPAPAPQQNNNSTASAGTTQTTGQNGSTTTPQQNGGTNGNGAQSTSTNQNTNQAPVGNNPSGETQTNASGPAPTNNTQTPATNSGPAPQQNGENNQGTGQQASSNTQGSGDQKPAGNTGGNNSNPNKNQKKLNKKIEVWKNQINDYKKKLSEEKDQDKKEYWENQIKILEKKISENEKLVKNSVDEDYDIIIDDMLMESIFGIVKEQETLEDPDLLEVRELFNSL